MQSKSPVSGAVSLGISDNNKGDSAVFAGHGAGVRHKMKLYPYKVKLLLP